MRNSARAALFAFSSILWIGSASAADMTAAEIKELIVGKSVYLELTAASVAGTAGQGVIYYAPDGVSLYKTAKGVMWHGTWTMKDNTVCNVWKETTNNACTGYVKDGGVISITNVSTGQVRGKVVKTADGNAEKLVP